MDSVAVPDPPRATYTLTDKSQALAWAVYLLTGEVANSELVTFIFGLSSQGERLAKIHKGHNT